MNVSVLWSTSKIVVFKNQYTRQGNDAGRGCVLRVPVERKNLQPMMYIVLWDLPAYCGKSCEVDVHTMMNGVKKAPRTVPSSCCAEIGVLGGNNPFSSDRPASLALMYQTSSQKTSTVGWTTRWICTQALGWLVSTAIDRTSERCEPPNQPLVSQLQSSGSAMGHTGNLVYTPPHDPYMPSVRLIRRYPEGSPVLVLVEYRTLLHRGLPIWRFRDLDEGQYLQTHTPQVST